MPAPALLLLRLAFAALLLAFHGAGRFAHAFAYLTQGEPWPFIDVVGQLGFPFAAAFAVLSALSESLGAVLVGAGVWTRAAAVAIAANMLVACYNEAAQGDRVELPLLYFLIAVFIALTGAGRFSGDALRLRRKLRAQDHLGRFS